MTEATAPWYQKNVKWIVYAEPWIYVDLYYSIFLRAINACEDTYKLDGYDDDAATYLSLQQSIKWAIHPPKTEAQVFIQIPVGQKTIV